MALARTAARPGAVLAWLPVGRPAVSKHLRVLSDAGLIEHRSAGTRNLYALVLGRYQEHVADGNEAGDS